MKYRLYRLSFPHGVHIGEHNLDESLTAFRADTLFSAMFMEALKISDKAAMRFLQEAKAGTVKISDAFPYIGDTEYLPKPMCKVEVPDQQGDSVIKKAFKALSYVPMGTIEQYLQGKLDAVAEKENLSKLGVHGLKTSVAIAGQDETQPYHVGMFYFNDGNGLYIIMGTESGNEAENILEALSYSGIGGKRSSGFGRFQIEDIRDLKEDSFTEVGSTYMSLSTVLPTEDEMENALKDASYQMVKRGGFIASETYASELRKKKDLYAMAAGSCFCNKFLGDIYDVSEGGTHPVYRYAKPLFWTLRR
ncbi:MAG: type III-A CRISPR-associated RAMP protein Csm4 [Lachnospiraceae bacterium]|nr:type III-A CRISPR-associated RAMP protein Csm4 [Lachnospiraceae bacterium]